MDTIYTKNAPDAIGPYSQAVKIGDMLYTSGQIAINPATGNVEAADIVGQSKQVMANLKAVLRQQAQALTRLSRPPVSSRMLHGISAHSMKCTPRQWATQSRQEAVSAWQTCPRVCW